MSQRQSLKVSENGRYLVAESGKPFFYLGDTAWELFHRTTREDAGLYLGDRAAKGFTVIQTIGLAVLDGLRTPNAYGHRPLIRKNPERPDVRPGVANDYWDHVDWVVDRAAELGLFIAMAPTWGDKWLKKWEAGPQVFNERNARVFGRFIGSRYREKPLIWILGGDRNPESDAHLRLIRAMAEGLREGDGGSHLMTYHPMGDSSSSRWFHQDAWLAFDMFQSGHARLENPNYKFTLHDRALEPPKPVIDGEPCYEDHPVNWHSKGETGWFDDWDVRRAAYLSMLCGAAGHTYGNHDVWQFFEPGRAPVSYARTPWRKALSHPGAFDMGHLRHLLTARSFHLLVPDQGLLAAPEGDMRAARAADDSFALVYSPKGQPVRIVWRKRILAWWFNPRNGSVQPAVESAGEFRPPTNGRGHDWMLTLDNNGSILPRLEARTSTLPDAY